MTSADDAPAWVWGRPATTVQCDPRLGRPGHKHRGPDCCKANREAGEGEAMFARDSVRLTADQRAILQGFPPDYPWQGTSRQVDMQIGNAVPPPLARAVLLALVGPTR